MTTTLDITSRFDKEMTSPNIREVAEKIAYKEHTYEIVSTLAYLTGVSANMFDGSRENTDIKIFKKLDMNKNARIIRHLCIIRTAIERNYRNIFNAMRFDYRTLINMPEYVPQESLRQLSEDGINVLKGSNAQLNQHIIEINRIISDRINNCKNLFPLWLNWQYIKELFVIPNGLTEQGIKDAAEVYYSNTNAYPYHVYINWVPGDDGNIFYCDKKFVTLLYKRHGEEFNDYNKVSDAGDYIKNNVYDFIDEHEKIVILVDCENSDPYRLCATFKNLSYEYTQKISKIILFDDVHTSVTWRMLDSFVTIPIEHMMIERIKESKSLVDMKLATRACKEFYQNNVDAFVIMSSDSDYWALISSLPDADFLVMVEHEKCGPDMKAVLSESGIFYCYIDDFYSGNCEDIKQTVLFKEINATLNSALNLNARTMLNDALITTRIHMTQVEQQQFYDKYIRNMYLDIDVNGDVSIKLNIK